MAIGKHSYRAPPERDCLPRHSEATAGVPSAEPVAARSQFKRARIPIVPGLPPRCGWCFAHSRACRSAAVSPDLSGDQSQHVRTAMSRRYTQDPWLATRCGWCFAHSRAPPEHDCLPRHSEATAGVPSAEPVAARSQFKQARIPIVQGLPPRCGSGFAHSRAQNFG